MISLYHRDFATFMNFYFEKVAHSNGIKFLSSVDFYASQNRIRESYGLPSHLAGTQWAVKVGLIMSLEIYR